MSTSTLTKRSYVVVTMRKMREKVISKLAEIKIKHLTNYAISAANEVSVHFQLNLKSKSLTDQSAVQQKTQIENALKEIFPGVVVSFIGVKTDGVLRIDLEVDYNLIHPIEEVSKEVKKDQDVTPQPSEETSKSNNENGVVFNEVDQLTASSGQLETSKKEIIRFSPKELLRQNQPVVSRRKPNPRKIKERPVLPLTEEMLNYKIVDLPLFEVLKLCRLCSWCDDGRFNLYYVTAEVMEKYFSHLEENREIIEPHVESIEDSYVAYDYHYTEAIVNEKLQIIDAQHRIEVAVRNNLGMYFKIKVGWGMDEVTLYNVNNKNWNDLEYLNSYSKRGIPAYMVFKEFYDKHEFDFSTCEVLFKGYRMKKTKKASEDVFRNKKLKISSEEQVKAENRAMLIKDFEEFHPVGWRSRNFVETIIQLSESPKYNHSEMLKKLKNLKEESQLKKAKSSWRIAEYFIFLAKLFNKGRHDDNDIIPIPSRFLEEII